MLGWDLRVKTANPSFYGWFQETEGRMVYEFGNEQWNIPVCVSSSRTWVVLLAVYHRDHLAEEYDDIPLAVKPVTAGKRLTCCVVR